MSDILVKLKGLRHMWDEAHDEMHRLTGIAVAQATPILKERFPVGSQVMVCGRGGDPELCTVVNDNADLLHIIDDCRGGGTMETHVHRDPWRVYVTRKSTTGLDIFIYPLFSDVIPMSEWSKGCSMSKTI